MVRYLLTDLPKFGEDGNKDPFEFLFQFQNFLSYINLKVTTPDKVESAIQLFGSCMCKKGRIYFQENIGATPKVNGVETKRTVEQWNTILTNFCVEFHPLGRTRMQLTFVWDYLIWNPQVETIEEFIHKVHQLAKILNKNDEDQLIKIKHAAPNKEVYLVMVTCKSESDIIERINKWEALHWSYNSFHKTSNYVAPGLNYSQVHGITQLPPTEYENEALLSQEIVATTCSEAEDSIDKMNRLSEKLPRLAKDVARQITKFRYYCADINKPPNMRKLRGLKEIEESVLVFGDVSEDIVKQSIQLSTMLLNN